MFLNFLSGWLSYISQTAGFSSSTSFTDIFGIAFNDGTDLKSMNKRDWRAYWRDRAARQAGQGPCRMKPDTGLPNTSAQPGGRIFRATKKTPSLITQLIRRPDGHMM